jgi:acetyl-CoA carboxylase carboxyltransferase component
MDINGRNFIRFLERQSKYESQNSAKMAEKQHAKGKLLARERIEILFDHGTFEEIDAFVTPAISEKDFGKSTTSFGDGVIIGHGKISNRLAFAYAQDFNIMGGSMGVVHAAKVAKIQDMALKLGAPIIGLIDSGGA